MKYILFLLCLVFVFPVAVFAEDTTTTMEITSAPTPTFTTTTSEATTTPKSTFRHEVMQQREINKEMKIENREDKQASIAAIKQNRQELKTAFQQKLTTFKDQVKAERVNRIETLFTTINTNRTAEMEKRLETMDSILTKLDTTIADIEKNGKDTTAVKQAIADTRTALAAAKQAVEAQSQKDYTITISSESTVKTDIMPVRESLYTDLQTVHQHVAVVREKLVGAIEQIKLLIGGTSDGK
jgi:hypothetical protein